MTVLIGVKCSDGVVVGADSAATSAAGQVHLLKMAADKICIVENRVIVAGTGQIGLGQRFIEVVRNAHQQKLFQNTTVEVAKSLNTACVNDFASTGAPKGAYGALLAAPLEDDAQLIEFAVADLQPEIKNLKTNFVSMGSGQTLAEPFMSFVSRTFWNNRTPDVKTALFGVHWALSHTIKCAPGMVGDPIVLATLRNGKKGWGAELVSQEELEEQAEHIEAIEQYISRYRTETLADVQAEQVPTAD